MESKTLGRITEVLDQMVEEIRALALPTLGQEFSSLGINELHEALVSHRVVTQYEIPVPQAASLRKQLSIQEVLQHDSNAMPSFDPRLLPNGTRHDFYRAAEWLRDFFQGFQHTYRLRFPQNEGLVSARGLTDLVYKLRHTRYWCVSPDLVDYVCQILLRNRALLSVVKQRFKSKYGKYGSEQLDRLRREAFDRGMTPSQWRFYAVKYMFRACTTLQRHSRITTVPKNNSRDRVITCEALWTMVAQLSYATSLREHMRLKLGITLETLQTLHRSLIRTGKATVDLSKASDSNLMVVLAALWPQRQYRWLERMRTGIFSQKSKEGTIYTPLNMFAPMGCGCTFEVMTLTLLAHCRVLDKGATVFGDDIIIAAEQAPRLYTNLRAQGWVINENKSFTSGPFRESCGGFVDLRTDKALLSYDMPRPVTSEDCYIFMHKMLRLWSHLPPGELRSIFRYYYSVLHSLVPRDALVDTTEWELDPSSPLTETNFHMVEIGRGIRPVKTRKKGVSAILSGLLQRPVRVTRVKRRTAIPLNLPHEADPTLYCAFMHRGMSYEVDGKRTRVDSYDIDAFTGTPVREYLIANVLTERNGLQA